MNDLFQDEFMNTKLFYRLAKEIRKEQLNKTISEIDYLNELQSHIISKCDFTKEQNQQLNFIKKTNNARQNNIQA